jgi:TonB-dependent SusC/RagA subfamily outer membrane receptor
MKRVLLLILSVFTAISFISAQKVTISGKISDAATNTPLIQATIKINDKATVTDTDGQYQLEIDKADRYKVVVSYVGFENYEKETVFTEGVVSNFNISLEEANALLQTATVTAGKFEKPLSQVTVSMDVLKAQLIENVNTRKVDDVLQKVPGVNIIDGQANIRGGSGWSYGAGSRVLLLVDDIPAVQGDAGFPNWKDIPVENIEQIEVIKGASSALYGSSAMNGVINIRTGFAKLEPETKVTLQSAFYLTPKDAAKKWWTKTPYEATASIMHKQKFGKLDVVGTLFYYNLDSYNKDWYDKFGRFTTNLRYRITDRLSVGLNANVNTGASQSFFYWQNDTKGAYIGTTNAFTTANKTRYILDPYLNYFDKHGNQHKILTRRYSVKNDLTNNQQNKSDLNYGEYQVQRKMEKVVITAGLVGIRTGVNAKLYGDTIFKAVNLAAYAQSDINLGKLNLSAGVRFEQNTINGPKVVKYTATQIEAVPNGGQLRESKPVFRIGANYQVGKATFLRASWGQGYRFPTIAEMFISTQAGGIPVIPNPALTSETGWSTEFGVKQGFKIGGLVGFADASVFWSEYSNMMEFQATSRPNIIGFQSQNVSNTVIKGYEASVAGQAKMDKFGLSFLIGYTYIDPKYKIFTKRDSSNSTAGFNILKYRFKHNFKFDAEVSFDKISIGAAVLYNSHMDAIDRILNDFLPGIKAFRNSHTTGFTTLDVRVAFKPTKFLKLTVIGANILNEEYAYRPGVLDAPRNVSARMDFTF